MDKKFYEKMCLRAEKLRAKAETMPVNGRCICVPASSGAREVYFYRAQSRCAGAVFVLHGGGFLFGSARNCDPYCTVLAKRTDYHVISIDYRCTSEAAYPAALEDVCSVIGYFAENAGLFGIDTNRLVCAGHSAGANLAAAAALALKAGTLAALVLNYPLLDQTGESLAAIGETASETSVLFRELYSLPNQRKDPLISPIFASDEALAAFPPTAIFCADNDPLKHEALHFAARLEIAGALHLCKTIPGTEHAFIEHELDLVCGESVPERRAAVMDVLSMTAGFLENI